MKKIVFYLPLFYPDKNKFYQILDFFEKYKVDYLEVGLPAKNPYMDGERIARAHRRLWEMEYSDQEYLDALKEIRRKYSFRLILMGYYEEFARFPVFFTKESECYFDAMLCVDLPDSDMAVNNIPIINEQHTQDQICCKIANSPLFAYIMSSIGKTGSGELRDRYIDTIRRVKDQNNIPCFVGFQIKTAEDVRTVLKNGADGAIIGSELLKQIELGLDSTESYIKRICREKDTP